MNGVKRVCKTVGKIAFSVVVGVGLIGFVKGLFVGYLICHYKDKCSLHNIKCTDKTDEEQKQQICFYAALKECLFCQRLRHLFIAYDTGIAITTLCVE